MFVYRSALANPCSNRAGPARHNPPSLRSRLRQSNRPQWGGMYARAARGFTANGLAVVAGRPFVRRIRYTRHRRRAAADHKLSSGVLRLSDPNRRAVVIFDDNNIISTCTAYHPPTRTRTIALNYAVTRTICLTAIVPQVPRAGRQGYGQLQRPET